MTSTSRTAAARFGNAQDPRAKGSRRLCRSTAEALRQGRIWALGRSDSSQWMNSWGWVESGSDNGACAPHAVDPRMRNCPGAPAQGFNLRVLAFRRSPQELAAAASFSRRWVILSLDSLLRTAIAYAAGSPTMNTFLRPRVIAV